MHPNAQLITRFYGCFQDRAAAGMGACYHPRARFSDPVFPDLDAEGARAMWAMLCERGKDLQVELGTVAANDRVGSAHWEAWYTFSGTGRAVACSCQGIRTGPWRPRQAAAAARRSQGGPSTVESVAAKAGTAVQRAGSATG